MRKYSGLIALLIILGVKACILGVFIQDGSISLGPDEAQYWGWSQNLDWGYYSKPPGIAWQIGLGCAFFGNNELGVRAGALFISSLTVLAVYLCGRLAGAGDRVSALGAGALALSPMGIMGSLLATTDGGLVLFWTVSMALLVYAIKEDRGPSWVLLGIAVALGALFKWAIFLMWPLVAIGMCFFPAWRSFKAGFFVVISLLGLLPSLIWNIGHDWASFRHVWGTNVSPHGGGNALEFLGAQAALFSPVLFAMMLVSAVALIRRKRCPSAVAFLGWCWLGTVVLYTVMAVFKKVQGNWCIFVYPAGACFMAWYAVYELKRGRLWLKWGMGLSVLACSVILALPSLQAKTNLPYKMNPFRHALGWNQIAGALMGAGYQGEGYFLFGDKYQTSSLLYFYNPEQKRPYFFNVSSSRKNQFSYWAAMSEEQKGKDGFFIWAENLDRIEDIERSLDNYKKSLSDYFARVTFVGEFPLVIASGKAVKSAFIFRCERYNGLEPDQVNHY